MVGRGHILRVVSALTLTLAAWGPASFTLGAGLAHAKPNVTCSQYFDCTPQSINFEQQGNYGLAGVRMCGIEDEYAPLGSEGIDSNLDDRDQINRTNEGNYYDSEAIDFQPATGSSVGAGEHITIGLPHPAESYANAGSLLPQADTPDIYTPYEQGAATVAVSSYGFGTGVQVTVTVPAGYNGDHIRLDAFNPYSPQPVNQSPGPGVNGNTHANINGYNVGTGKPPSDPTAYTGLGNSTAANGSDVAYFLVTDGSNEDVVVAATDTTADNAAGTPGTGIEQTAGISFGTGTNPSGQPCQGAQLYAPAGPSTSGFTYIFIENGYGYIVTQATVSSASGRETAVLTVPPDVPYTSSPVTLLILDAESPPGQGTPSHSLSSPDVPYPPDDFTVSTSEDPVPGYPSNAPTFQADASNQLPAYPVDGGTSTLIASEPTSSVSDPTAVTGPSSTLMVTATLNDVYNNPVNNKQVSIFQTPGTHANITPGTPPSGTEYPVSANDGTVTYSVADSCAESNVTFEGVDVDDEQYIDEAPQVTFTPAAAVAPDGVTTPVACGPNVASAKSQVTVTVDGMVTGPGLQATAPADGTTQALVSVTLGDQFGNADACQQVVLSAVSRTAHASITPIDPTNPCPGDDIAGYSGTDGVALFDVSDSASEDVVFGVADATVLAVWPSSAITNPKDVANVNFLGGSAGSSTVVASAPSAPADGQPAATVTVTLENSGGQVLQGKSVTLAGCTNNPGPGGSCTPDPTSTITPPSQATGSNGQATFEVADSSTALPHTVYYQATDASDGVIVDDIASISFMEGGTSLGANPTTVIADGIGTSTLTFGLQDTGGNPISGVAVSLAASPSTGAGISPASTSTGPGGTAGFTVTDTQAGVVTFTATATYASTQPNCFGEFNAGTCTATAVTGVNFISAPNTFTISASPSVNVPADGLTASQVTLTALDAHGVGIGGLPVILSGSGGSGGSPQISPSSAVTASNGTATFSVTDATPETVTLSAAYTELDAPGGTSYPGIACTGSLCTTTITFVQTEAEASTVVASPASAPADGHSTTTVLVTLKSGSGSALNGHFVVLTTGSTTTTVVASNIGGQTGISGPGQVSFTVTDTTPEVLSTVYARDENTGAIINEVATLTFLPTEQLLSTVTAAPSPLPANGPPGTPSTSIVTVTLLGPGCTAGVSGHTIKLTTVSGTANISPAQVTGSSGVAVFDVTDTAAETIVLYATDTTCGYVLSQSVSLTFTPSETNESSVLMNPISTPASGPPATLSVTLRSATGAPISGRTVTVPAVAHAKVTPLAYPGFAPGVTNASGLAQFAISDTTVESLTLDAFDGATELDQVATVNFTAGEANQSSLSAPVTTLPAGGTPTIVTLTLRAGGGAPISGDVVSLSAYSPTTSIATIAPATATTNAVGQAQFTVGDARVQTITVTALDRTTGATVYQTLTLNFVADEQTLSTVTANPTVLSVKKASLITVTLLGPTGLGVPLVGHTVLLSTGSSTTKITLVTHGGKTTATGQIQFRVTDKTRQVITITVTDTTAGFNVTIYMTVTVTFVKA
jgi:adhesin/invasin